MYFILSLKMIRMVKEWLSIIISADIVTLIRFCYKLTNLYIEMHNFTVCRINLP